MKKYILIGVIGLLAVLLVSVGFSKPETATARVGPSNGKAVVSIPANAVEVAPNVFSLGTAVDDGRVVEGFAIVHRKKGFGKPGTTCGNGVCEAGENAKKCPSDCGGSDGGDSGSSTCYGFLANGAKWKTAEPYVVNPANNEGMNETFVASNFAADIDKWEAAAGTEILGAGSTTTAALVADMQSTDGQNEVYFGEISNAGAIAVTIVWGIFRGPPQSRELVEWDQIYDEVDFDWSASGEASKMDFENIATHELGHSVGLGDLYQAECSQETMYGYASNGETSKQTLEAGDITGVQELYK